MALQQLQPSDQRAVSNRFAQGLQCLVKHPDCPLELAGQLQQLDSVDAEHYLIEHTALEPCELHALAVVVLGKLQLAFGHGLLRQNLQTEDALRPGVVGEHFQRLQAVLSRLGLAAQTRQKAP